MNIQWSVTITARRIVAVYMLRRSTAPVIIAVMALLFLITLLAGGSVGTAIISAAVIGVILVFEMILIALLKRRKLRQLAGSYDQKYIIRNDSLVISVGKDEVSMPLGDLTFAPLFATYIRCKRKGAWTDFVLCCNDKRERDEIVRKIRPAEEEV